MAEGYDRRAAAGYARRWAMGRNPRYWNFTGMGGDCTNFVSQCLYAGGCRMNFTRDLGWYYRSPEDRAAAWSGVEYLYRFLMGHTGPGPRARLQDPAPGCRTPPCWPRGTWCRCAATRACGTTACWC